MKRGGAAHHFAPEITSHDLESPNGGAKPPFGAGDQKMVGLNGAPLNIQSFQGNGDNSKNRRGKGAGALFSSQGGNQQVFMVIGGVWLLGVFMGYEWTWPLSLVLDLLYTVLNIPPFSWVFGWISTPLSWIFGWFYKGAPLVEQVGALQELRLPNDQVPTYLDSYVQQYGDAALIFASHDGYPQIVNGLLYNKELGYRDLVDATDENGNTALIYASAKGYRQTTAALLRSGADPDIANQGGGGRTPLMEAAGGGHKDIVAAIRLSNATIDMIDDFQNTALHYAAYHGHLQVVHELLKGNPPRDVKNSYGHTPASYALSNKHKAISDLLSRVPTRREVERLEKEKDEKEREEKEKEEFEKDPDHAMKALAEQLGLGDILGGDKKKKAEEVKHVKGHAEELHKGDSLFAPTTESTGKSHGISDAERKSLEDQLAKLKHQHDESELKAQKRIVELLEKNSGHQKALDDKDREARELKLNHTELQMRVQELETKHRSSESRATEEKERADRLHEEKQNIQLEVDRHRSRAEGAERERDMHMEASRRHEDTIKRTQQEVTDHLNRIDQHQREMHQLREELHQKEEELRRHKGAGSPAAASYAAPTPPPPPAPTPSPPSPPPAVSPAVEQPPAAENSAAGASPSSTEDSSSGASASSGGDEAKAADASPSATDPQKAP